MFNLSICTWVYFEISADTTVHETERNAENYVYLGIYVFILHIKSYSTTWSGNQCLIPASVIPN